MQYLPPSSSPKRLSMLSSSLSVFGDGYGGARHEGGGGGYGGRREGGGVGYGGNDGGYGGRREGGDGGYGGG
ncbi:hypothetical protein AgCh_003277 [Apium graveolens]